jgi:hypothetical protein
VASKEAEMTHRSLACLIAALAFAAACGGGQPEATQPANPAPSAGAAPSAAPAESAAPAASAAPSASAAPAASAAPPAEAAPPAAPGPGDWDKWSHDQKMAYMKAVVMPKMGGLFHDMDAKDFSDPKCTLCHGSGAKDGSFKMPSADIPKLPDPKEFKALAAKKPKVFDFMLKQVEPQMAALLGEQPYDPKTKQGFSCFDCHTKK